LIYDSFGIYETLEILEFYFENNILLYRLPSYTSYKLQLYNISVFTPLKAAYRNEVDRLEQGGVNMIGKEHFTFLYNPVRKRVFIPKNIKAGFTVSGLFPFNPDRILRSIPAPVVELVVQRVDKVRVGPYRQEKEPQTPVTPVSAESFIALQNLILQRHVYILDETSKKNLVRYL
jgi:hypothetical protein